jgi:hypothetical protein
MLDKNKQLIQTTKQECVKIITNITNKTEEQIYELYNSRWDIEEFIKQLKTNFKFQKMDEYNEDNYNKLIYCELIEMLLKNILIKLYEIKHKFSNNQKCSYNKNKTMIDASIKVNENLILNGIKTHLIMDVINGTLTIEKINTFFESYFVKYKNKTNRSNPRVSKIPFSKWYVKKYHELYKIKHAKIMTEIKELYIQNKTNTEIIQIKKQIIQLKKDKQKILQLLNNNTD